MEPSFLQDICLILQHFYASNTELPNSPVSEAVNRITGVLLGYGLLTVDYDRQLSSEGEPRTFLSLTLQHHPPGIVEFYQNHPQYLSYPGRNESITTDYHRLTDSPAPTDFSSLTTTLAGSPEPPAQSSLYGFPEIDHLNSNGCTDFSMHGTPPPLDFTHNYLATVYDSTSNACPEAALEELHDLSVEIEGDDVEGDEANKTLAQVIVGTAFARADEVEL